MDFFGNEGNSYFNNEDALMEPYLYGHLGNPYTFPSEKQLSEGNEGEEETQNNNNNNNTNNNTNNNNNNNNNTTTPNSSLENVPWARYSLQHLFTPQQIQQFQPRGTPIIPIYPHSVMATASQQFDQNADTKLDYSENNDVMQTTSPLDGIKLSPHDYYGSPLQSPEDQSEQLSTSPNDKKKEKSTTIPRFIAKIPIKKESIR